MTEFGLGLLTPNYQVRTTLGVAEIPVEWLLPPDWSDLVEWKRGGTDAFLERTFDVSGGKELGSLALWRRLNYFHFQYVVAAFQSAKAVSAQLRSRNWDLTTIALPVNPAEMKTLSVFSSDDTFVLFLKSLVPELQLIDERDGRPIDPDELVRFGVGVDFEETDFSGGLPPDTDVLFCNAATRDSGFNFAPPGSKILTVGSMFSPVPGDVTTGAARRPEWIEISFGEAAIEPSTAGLVEVFVPVVRSLWLPRLRSLRDSCRELIAATSPQQIIVCDHVFPETAMLVAERAPGTAVTILPHGPGGVDVALWSDVVGATARVPTRTSQSRWESHGTAAVVDAAISPKLRDVYVSEPPVASSQDALRILHVGGAPALDCVPLSGAQAYEDSLSTVLSIPKGWQERVMIRSKPRPNIEHLDWYLKFLRHEQLLPVWVPLVEEFSAADLVVVVEQPSSAMLEAISQGCVVVAVATNPTDPQWVAGDSDLGGQVFDPDVIPLAHPEAYWELVQSLVNDRRLLREMWRSQTEWLRSELETDVGFRRASLSTQAEAGLVGAETDI